MRRQTLEAAIVDLLSQPAESKTICPSQAARAVGGRGWRDRMPLGREAAASLVRELSSLPSCFGVILRHPGRTLAPFGPNPRRFGR
ncbi:MAG: DUF3253 domain-containing protein [Actinomycetota bacterium]|nr:DUF3253 domain-containing protein [Actinomycetota bacterium]